MLVTVMPDARSSLKRPPKKLLQNFDLDKIDRDDTIRAYLERGYSLAICCKDCPRLIEWTPPDLEQRFGERLDLRIRDLAARLTCAGEVGCGSRNVAVYPHLYDWPWDWPPRA
jgi:hypothetical protein